MPKQSMRRRDAWANLQLVALPGLQQRLQGSHMLKSYLTRKQTAVAHVESCSDLFQTRLCSPMLQAAQSVQAALKQVEEARDALAEQLTELQHQHAGELEEI